MYSLYVLKSKEEQEKYFDEETYNKLKLRSSTSYIFRNITYEELLNDKVLFFFASLNDDA